VVYLVLLSVIALESLDELDAGALAELALLISYGTRPEYRRLTSFKELLQLIGEPATSLDKLLNHLPVLLRPDLGDGFLGVLNLSRQLDKEELQLAGYIADRRASAIVVDGLVVDLLA
jgi:hypothetical protein